jgi:hypothetical protein
VGLDMFTWMIHAWHKSIPSMYPWMHPGELPQKFSEKSSENFLSWVQKNHPDNMMFWE